MYKINEQVRESDRRIAEYLNKFDEQSIIEVSRIEAELVLESLKVLIETLTPSGACRDEARKYIELGADYFVK